MTSQSPNRSFVIATVLFFSFIGLCLTVLGVNLYNRQKGPKTIAGQEVVFSNTYRTSQRVTVEGDRVVMSGCQEELVTLDLTLDTLVLTTPRGVLGFKPLYVNDEQDLVCTNAAGEEVKFARLYPKGADQETPENEVLLYFTQYGCVALNAKNECIDKSQIPVKSPRN